VEIKVSLWDIQNSFPEDEEPDEIAQMVSDMFNIKLTPVNVGWGDANEKYNTWAASGQLPDIIGAIAMPGTGRYYQWINDGVVRPLPDVSNYYYINELMELPEVTAFAVDGQNYFLPRSTYADPAWWAMDRGLTARRDWMEKIGIEDPQTEEDYINLTVAMAKEDPDGNGADDTVGFTPVSPWILFSQGWTGLGYTDQRWMREPDGKIRIPISGVGAFTMYQFFKKMFQAGGLDPDFATLESGQAVDKFASGKVGILGRQVSPKHLKIVMDSWVKLQPDKDFVESIVILHGPTVDGSYTRFSEKAYWSESYIEANVDDTKMERILELYNWLYSEEGMYTMHFGISGKDYDMESDGNIKLLTPVDEETGLHVGTSELYPFTYAMSYLAGWTGDLLQYVDPAIPLGIRELTTAERDHRVANWKDPEVNYAIQAIDVPEKQEMVNTFSDDWVRFIADASGQSDRDLYEAMKENWDANGYAAAIDAITAKAQELGIE
jgi:putative aldouronate transport system substrate-binding protein